MPNVRLRYDHPTEEFRRTIQVGKAKPVQLVFRKDEPTAVTKAQLEALQQRDSETLRLVTDAGKNRPLDWVDQPAPTQPPTDKEPQPD